MFLFFKKFKLNVRREERYFLKKDLIKLFIFNNRISDDVSPFSKKRGGPQAGGLSRENRNTINNTGIFFN